MEKKFNKEKGWRLDDLDIKLITNPEIKKIKKIKHSNKESGWRLDDEDKKKIKPEELIWKKI